MRSSGLALGIVSVLVVVGRAPPASASEGDGALEEMSLEQLLDVEVDVGSLEASTVLRTPSTVTVISRETLLAYGFRSVAEALEVVAGYEGVRTYSTRGVPTIRGLLNFHYANKVLLLVDGVPTWSAVTGHTVIDRIPIDAVERIEILKGPASVLYGSNAYAGAINIVLRRGVGVGDGASARAAAGTGDAYAAAADLRVTRRGVTLEAALEVVDEGDGPPRLFIDEDGEPGLVRDFARGANVIATLRHGHHRVLFDRYRYAYMRLGATPTFADGAGHDQVHLGTLVDYRYRRAWGDRVDVVGSVTWDEHTRDFDRSADGELRTNEHGWRAVGALNARVVLGPVYAELGGAAEERTSVQYRNYRVSDDATLSENNLRDRSVNEASLFAQLGHTGERLGAVAGARVTRNELSGFDLASRATVSYAVNDNHALKLVFGQSFRAPSLFELYFTTDEGTVLGNAALAPETSTSLELVHVGRIGSVVVQGTGYYARYDDIIYRELVGGVNTYENGAPLDAIGVELEVERTIGASRGFARLAYLDSQGASDPALGYDVLQFAPRVTGDAGLSHVHGALALSGIVHYRGASPGPNARVGMAWTVDTGLAYRLSLEGHPAELRLDARNLGDETVWFPEYVRRDRVNAVPRDGFGRQIFVGLRGAL